MNLNRKYIILDKNNKEIVLNELSKYSYVLTYIHTDEILEHINLCLYFEDNKMEWFGASYEQLLIDSGFENLSTNTLLRESKLKRIMK